MLPALSWVIEAVDDRLQVDHAFIANRSANTVIQLKVTPIRILVIGGRILMPNAQLHFDPTTLIGSVLQPVILLLAIILAWPVTQLLALPARLLLAVPMMGSRGSGFPNGLLERFSADRRSVGIGDCGRHSCGVGGGSMDTCSCGIENR
ncbi:MAG: hypothetical protein FD131_2257 [Rhodocyclaceae bacterium]|nr:MAG: hypothetical protein FD131_2257 [Rhodocyclaceae bacterium]